MSAENTLAVRCDSVRVPEMISTVVGGWWGGWVKFPTVPPADCSAAVYNRTHTVVSAYNRLRLVCTALASLSAGIIVGSPCTDSDVNELLRLQRRGGGVDIRDLSRLNSRKTRLCLKPVRYNITLLLLFLLMYKVSLTLSSKLLAY
ncbi:hypothetical protein QTP88_024279 [Uroleucon formosanum]